MKILLIQPPWYGFQNIISNRLYLGLAYLGAVLEKAGHEILILNGELYFENLDGQGETVTVDKEKYKKNFTRSHYVYQKIIKDILDFQPDAIAISFMTAGSTSAYYLVEYIRQSFRNIPLIAGGIHPTLVPEEPLKKGFDYVIRGEGEATIVELIKLFADKNMDIKKITGISFKDGDQIRHNENRPFIADLDELPFPAFYLMKDYKQHTYSCKGIIASRGCPFECTYCASKLLWTRAVRFRSPANVVEEIKDRHERLGVTSFAFGDDTFTLRPAFVEEFCRRVLDLDFKIKWHCDTRGDTLDFSLLKLMKRAGCNHVYLGLESGSPKIQKLIKKNLDTAKVKEAVRLSRQAGIETTIYFMVGFPNETKDDIEMSIDAMKDIKPDNAIWSILTLYPGTEIWNLALSQGLVTTDQDWSKSFHHYNQGNIFNSISKESWNEMLKIIYSEQKKLHNRITKIKIRKKIKALPKMIKIGLKKPSRILPYFINLIKR